MNIKTRLILIVALLGTSAVVLAVAFVQCGQTPAPVTTPPPATEPSGMADTGATPGATALPGETAVPATPEATAVTTPPDGTTTEPSAPAATPETTPTLTKEEEIVVEMQHHSSQSASSFDECAEILKTEPWCSVTESAERITRPEWEELFPETEFYVVRRDLYGGEFVQQRNLLIVEQDGQRYTAETFDRLLKANGVITITDENRELVAKAFALMTIPDYLEEEIVFTKWEEVDMPQARYPYNYCMDVWTKIEGLEAIWCFVFRNEQLKVASGPFVQQIEVGDYVPAPFFEESLSYLFKDYRFRGE